MSYNTNAIRELLIAALGDQEVVTFCFDHFRSVYENFTPEMGRLWKIQLLIDHCERHEQFAKLLTLVKDINPSQYNKFIPYIEERPRPTNAVTDSAKSQVEIVLQGDFSRFTHELRSAALAAAMGALAGVLNVPREQISVVPVQEGSTILRIRLPTKAANRLIALYKVGRPIIKDLGIQQVTAIPKQIPSNVANESSLQEKPKETSPIPQRRPAMERVKRFWNAFKNVAIVFSFVVNLILVFALLIVSTQLVTIKNQVAEPLVYGLDRSFAHLGDATIKTTIPIRQQLPVKFDLPVKFTLPLNQNTKVTTLTPTRINTMVNLSLGAFGNINAPVSLDLPAGTPLQVKLAMDIPVSTTVSVNQTVPVNFDQQVQIPLGKAGLQPVVTELRGVVKPYVVILQSLP
jgi:hypothetical protein